MMELVNRIRLEVSRRVKATRAHAAISRFKGFSRRKWGRNATDGRDSVVLVGLFSFFPSLFCYAYVVNYLAKKHGSRIECYQFIGQVSPLIRGVYESFGARFGLGMEDAAEHESAAQAQAAIILAGLKTKQDVLRITVDGLLIGDQIYDSYLRYYSEPTVRLDDPRFAEVVEQALRIYYAARAYLARTRVTAFIVDDFSYINAGILTRLLFQANVPLYMVAFGTPFWLLRLDPEPSGEGHNFPPPVCLPYYAYRRMFAKLSDEKKAEGLRRAREALESRLSGQYCPLVGLPSTSFAPGSQRVLDDGPEPKILVMMHNFVDAPHCYRRKLFADFYEWIVFLLERAEKTPFRWYVKPHPYKAPRAAINAANQRVVEELKLRFPKITFLPETTSSHQILEDGLTAMFTVHGTAGHEFAYRGVPVVNCGDNPHISYPFNIHVDTLEAYETCIREADRLPVKVDRADIEEFFYMHYFFLPDHLGSPVSPIDERLLVGPDWLARVNQATVLNDLIKGATAEREHGLTEYFDRFFGQPDLMQTSANL